MSDRVKRILLIVGLLVVTAALAYALYYLFKKSGPLAVTPTGQPTVTTTAGGVLPPSGATTATSGEVGPGVAVLPQAGAIPQVQPSYYQAETVKKITDAYTAYASANQKGDLRFYNQNDGKFYYIAADGSTQTMSDAVFYNVQKVTWAKSADKAVLEYPDNSKIVYNFETEKQATLPKHWTDFSFSSDSQQIAAKSIGLAEENRWLVVTNDDGSGTKLVEALGQNQDKVIIDWSPSRQTVAFAATGESLGLYRKEILLVGQNHENFKSLIVEGLGFDPKWSPSGKQLLYSIYSQRTNLKPELWLVNSYGNEIGSGRKSLEINTWPEKCAFAGETALYCAIPSTLIEGAGLKPELSAGTIDYLYKIDLATGYKTAVVTGDDYSVKEMSYDETNNRLLFTDYNQTGVFEIQL